MAASVFGHPEALGWLAALTAPCSNRRIHAVRVSVSSAANRSISAIRAVDRSIWTGRFLVGVAKSDILVSLSFKQKHIQNAAHPKGRANPWLESARMIRQPPANQRARPGCTTPRTACG